MLRTFGVRTGGRRLATGRYVRIMCIFIIPLLAHEHAVVEHDFTLGATRHESVMGDHDDRGALVMQLAEQGKLRQGEGVFEFGGFKIHI